MARQKTLSVDFGPQYSNNRPTNHWLAVNIGSDKLISRSNVLTEYVPSGPSARGGNRRYTYLVYKQYAWINDPDQPHIDKYTITARSKAFSC